MPPATRPTDALSASLILVRLFLVELPLPLRTLLPLPMPLLLSSSSSAARICGDSAFFSSAGASEAPRSRTNSGFTKARSFEWPSSDDAISLPRSIYERSRSRMGTRHGPSKRTNLLLRRETLFAR